MDNIHAGFCTDLGKYIIIVPFSPFLSNISHEANLT